ncbi:SOS response-associated peptidase [Inmirania thermothiophila]|uniref:Abasic site processing protein n=1 Tax=Inmirania thermothiophila TaxID=1750597 RepID=A0A3N1Y8N8_9GAMM|nr:SOS response-associated peptidase [Inmirania thermothiophila]ROR35163.1 putative SOS response-associated peptidase YedK [Inmirania thermothiophila]
MCGRFALHAAPAEIAERFGVAPPEGLAPRYNIAPTQPVLAVRAGPDGREAAWLRWGLIPAWSAGPDRRYAMINARAETAAARPAFRNALRLRRCLVPASGFYEWRRAGGRRQPWYVRARDGRPLGLAGLWERWRDPAGGLVDSVAVLTVPANRLVARIHERMPVIVPPDAYARWLDPDLRDPALVADLLVPAPEEALEAWPVAGRVNRADVDEPALIEPLHRR